MIVVLLYSGLWALTQGVGGSALAELYAKNYRLQADRDDRLEYFNIEAQGSTLRVEITNGSYFPSVIKGQAHAWAPFVLVWSWTVDKTDYSSVNHWHRHGTGNGLERWKDTTIYYWLFSTPNELKDYPFPYRVPDIVT